MVTVVENGIVRCNLTVFVQHRWFGKQSEVGVFLLQALGERRTDQQGVVPCQFSNGMRTFLHPTIVGESSVQGMKVGNKQDLEATLCLLFALIIKCQEILLRVGLFGNLNGGCLLNAQTQEIHEVIGGLLVFLRQVFDEVVRALIRIIKAEKALQI